MLLSLKVLTVLIAVAEAGPTVEAEAPMIDAAALERGGLTQSWQARLPLDARDSVSEAYLVDEALYVITDGGLVFSLQADVGLLRWGLKLTERDYRVYRPTHLRNTDGTGPVLIPTTTETFVYDRFSGRLLQSFVPAFPPGSAGVGYGDTLFMGSANGRFYSLRLRDPRTGRLTQRWEVVIGGPITATPVLYGRGQLLFASQSGVVFSCFAVDKSLDWAMRTQGPILGDPVVDASGVYVASLDRSLYKIHREIGEALWRVRFPGPLTEGPIVTAHTVFQYCANYGLTAVDADTGQEKWNNPGARVFVAHSRDRDVLFTRDRHLEVVEHETGRLLERIDAGAAVAAVSNPHDDAVYLLEPQGRVLCARLERVPYLRLQQVLAARRRLHLPPLDEAEAARAGSHRHGDEDEVRVKDPLRSRRDTE